MFNITGEVINAFFASSTERYPQSSYLVQILGDNTIESGQRRKEIVTMCVPFDIFEIMKNNIGKIVSLPIRLSISHDKIQPFIAQYHNNDCRTSSDCLYIGL